MERFWHRRDFRTIFALAVVAMVWSGLHLTWAFAADVYPSKRITWINPTKPGGGSDLVARCITLYLSKHLGAEIVIKNMAAARGRGGYVSIFNAKPDGYTIGDFNNAFVTDSISEPIEFDYTKYTYIARTGVSLHLLLSSKKGFKTWDEMMKASREKPLKWATSNVGGSGHVSCILLKEAAKIQARLINFPGAAEAANALLRGDVEILTTSESSTKGMIDAGEFRVLTVFGEKSHYPGVPSIAELGYPELTGPLGQHRLVVGPPKIPRAVTETLIAGLKKVMSDKEFLAQAAKIEFDPEPLYGADAEKQAHELFKYYDTITPVLKKYLQ